MSAALNLWGKEQSLHYWVLRDHQNQELCVLGVFPKSKQQGYGQHHPFTPTGFFQRVALGAKEMFCTEKHIYFIAFFPAESRLGSEQAIRLLI